MFVFLMLVMGVPLIAMAFFVYEEYMNDRNWERDFESRRLARLKADTTSLVNSESMVCGNEPRVQFQPKLYCSPIMKQLITQVLDNE